MPNTLTNNSFATATLLNGVTSAPRSLIDNQLIRSSDPTKDDSLDFYKFETKGISNLKINLTEISGDVKLSIYKSLNGSTPTDADTPLNIRASNTQRISDSYTSTSDPALADLPAGTYYIKVELANSEPIGNYNLLVTGSSKQVSNSLLWRDTSGSLKSWQLDGGSIIANSTFNSSTTPQVPSSLEIVSTGDFDGDGIGDILWRDTATSTMRIWLMANGTQIKDGGNLSVQDSTGQAITRDSQWSIGAVGDVDNDGITDIVWRNTTSGEVDLWFMNQNLVSSAVSLLKTGLGESWKVIGFANADNQFGSDLLWRNSNTDQLAIWTLSRNGFESGGTRILDYTLPQTWQVVAYEDFNRDGIADLVWRNEQSQQIAFWKMDSTSKTVAAGSLYSLSAAYKLIGMEDMNGDGRPNPLFWNRTSGDLAVWNIEDNGSSVGITGKFVTNASTGEQISIKNPSGSLNPEAIQDWSGDGKADILWRDISAKQVYYWKMDGSLLVEGSVVKDPNLPSQNVEILGNFQTTGVSYGAYRTTNIIQAKTSKFTQVTAGTSRDSAFNIGVLEGTGSFNDFVGGLGSINKSDWYTFTVETPSFLTALVSNATAPGTASNALKAEVYAENSNTPITSVTTATLPQGKYYIRVTHSDTTASNVATPYTLTFTGKVGITNLNAVATATNGFGLVLSKNSITLDTDSANNKIDVTSFKFENNGDFVANNVAVGFYLSKNGTFELATDKLITLTSSKGETITNNLLIRSSVSKGAQVNLSSAISGLTLSLPGKNDSFWDTSANYSIIARIDPNRTLIAEKKIDDNEQAATLSTIGVGNADLLGTAFTVAGNIKPSATISGTFGIKNQGGRSTGVSSQSVKVKFYISNDISIGSGDFLAFEKIIPATTGIAPATTLTDTYSFTLPTLSPITSTTPTKWDIYWDTLTANKTASFTGYVGMVIEFVDDADSSNNSNKGPGLDKATATVVPV